MTPTSSSGSGPAWRWPMIIIAALALHVILMASVAVIASRDPSFVVVPDHYQKAKNWDQMQAQMRASAELGWRATFVPSTAVELTGEREITIQLRDAQEQPIPGASLEVAWFHHARAAEIQRTKLTTDAAGDATARVPMKHPGEYDVSIRAAAGVQQFQTTLHSTVYNAGGKR